MQGFGEMHPTQETKDEEAVFWDSNQMTITLLLDENAFQKTRYLHTEYFQNVLP